VAGVEDVGDLVAQGVDEAGPGGADHAAADVGVSDCSTAGTASCIPAWRVYWRNSYSSSVSGSAAGAGLPTQ
jgi:hypothetical protein